MYEKLLVAVDHSEITERVLAAARNLATLSSGGVWVLREREVMPRAGLIATETSDEAKANADPSVAELAEAGGKGQGRGGSQFPGYAGRRSVRGTKPPGS